MTLAKGSYPDGEDGQALCWRLRVRSATYYYVSLREMCFKSDIF